MNTKDEVKKILEQYPILRKWPNPPDEQQFCLIEVGHTNQAETGIHIPKYCGQKLPCPIHTKDELCRYMILTPNPLHNGGAWCAEKYPCERHGLWKSQEIEATITMTNTKEPSWEEEFEEKFSDYIKVISIGQYNDKGVNIGFLSVHEVIKSFIRQLLANQRKEIVEECINLIAIHTEKDGSWCDTGEDMDWACRSRCVLMAIGRLQALKVEDNRE